MESPRATTINVSLPSTLKEFVLVQTRTGAYGSASEYIRMLIRDARERDLAGQGERAATSDPETAHR